MRNVLGVRLCAFVVVLLVASVSVQGAESAAVWEGGYYNYWHEATEWDIGVDPQNTASDLYHVVVTDAAYYLKLYNGYNRTVQTVSIGPGASLELRTLAELTGVASITNNGTIVFGGSSILNVQGGTLVNNGVIKTGYGSYYTSKFNGGTGTSISGSGRWDLTGQFYFQGTLTFESGVEITNTYYNNQLEPLNLYLDAVVTNYTTIALERAAGTTDIVQLMVNKSLTNRGRLEARAGAQIYVFANVNNIGGVFNVDADSNMHISGATGMTITGGDITGDGNLYVYGQNSPNKLSGVMIGSGITTHIRSREQLEIRDTLTNNGTIRMSAAATLWSDLRIGYTSGGATYGATINGTGQILFTTAKGSQNNEIWGYGLTLGSGQTIATNGADTYGDIWTDLTNYGTVYADGGWIDLGHHNTSSGMVTNHGMLKAGNSGTLYINQYSYTIIDNTGGSIIAETDGTVMIYAGKVDGGVMGGSGVIRILNSGMEFSGDLVPGESPGTLTLAGNLLTMTDSARLVIEINGMNPGEYDVLNVTGSLDLNGDLAIILGQGFTLPDGATFEFITGASNVTGGFDFVAVHNEGEDEPFALCDVVGAGDSMELGNFRDVPEPATMSLLALGGLALVRRRKCRHR